MPLNQVQVDFINDAARPFMETMIRILHELDTFKADYDAIQASADALPTSASVLDDAGDAPRADVPQLTGAQLSVLAGLAASMSAEVDTQTKVILVSKMARPLATVLRLA